MKLLFQNALPAIGIRIFAIGSTKPSRKGGCVQKIGTGKGTVTGSIVTPHYGIELIQVQMATSIATKLAQGLCAISLPPERRQYSNAYLRTIVKRGIVAQVSKSNARTFLFDDKPKLSILEKIIRASQYITLKRVTAKRGRCLAVHPHFRIILYQIETVQICWFNSS